MKLWIAGFAVAMLSGCGTIKTLNDEKGAADDLAVWRSECKSIPRTYSGTAYQFCNLNSPERFGSHLGAKDVGFDMILSAVADTLVLPYTGYMQAARGSIPVRRKDR